MPLITRIETRKPGYHVVSLEGRLDGTTVDDCELRISPLMAPATRTLVFDMQGLTYISSMGVRTILKANKAVVAGGGTCHMSNLQPQIQKVFEIANLLPGMKLFSSIQEADEYYDAIQKQALARKQ